MNAKSFCAFAPPCFCWKIFRYSFFLLFSSLPPTSRSLYIFSIFSSCKQNIKEWEEFGNQSFYEVWHGLILHLLHTECGTAVLGRVALCGYRARVYRGRDGHKTPHARDAHATPSRFIMKLLMPFDSAALRSGWHPHFLPWNRLCISLSCGFVTCV